MVTIEYEFNASTGSLTGIKNKNGYYQEPPSVENSQTGKDCILPGGTVLVIPPQIDGVDVKTIATGMGGNTGVFKDCTNITKVVIPSTVTQIGSLGGVEFAGCTSLKEVVIESNTVTMFASQFSGCSNLEKITFTNITAENAPSGSPWSAPATCQIEYKK